MLYPWDKVSTWLPDLALACVACFSARFCCCNPLQADLTLDGYQNAMLCTERGPSNPKHLKTFEGASQVIFVIDFSRTSVTRVVHMCSTASTAAPGLAMEHRLAILRLLAVSDPCAWGQDSLWFCLSEGRTGSSCLRVESLIYHPVDCDQSKQVIYLS